MDYTILETIMHQLTAHYSTGIQPPMQHIPCQSAHAYANNCCHTGIYISQGRRCCNTGAHVAMRRDDLWYRGTITHIEEYGEAEDKLITVWLFDHLIEQYTCGYDSLRLLEDPFLPLSHQSRRHLMETWPEQRLVVSRDFQNEHDIEWIGTFANGGAFV